MNPIQPKRSPLPDFVMLRHRFETLDNGPKAELRRVADLERIADVPAYYRWLAGYQPSSRLQRIASLVPLAAHASDAETLGRQLFKRRVSEMRLFQMLRADPPGDLEHLRRLLIYLNQPTLNWTHFGQTLFYWGPINKRRILQQYFTTTSTQRENPDE
jgi:CRISPR system Cascade subunit CasB